MFSILNVLRFYIFITVTGFTLFGCISPTDNEKRNNHMSTQEDSIKQITFQKKASIFSDTLYLEQSTAIFFLPDSFQLKFFKEHSTPAVYESTTHESEYQINNARLVLKRSWTHIQVINADRFRFIQYQKGLLDLNTINDLSGLILYKPGKQPLQVDMMNIDTELEGYFNQ